MSAKKGKNMLIKIVSDLGTGYFYVRAKTKALGTKKLSFKKYDPVARKHTMFHEKKLSN